MSRSIPTIRRRRAERGMALVIALFVMAVLLMVSGTAMLIGGSDLRATRNYRRISQARFAAESAISHAVQRVNTNGTVHFKNEIVDGWSALFGAGSKTFAPISGFTYTVAAIQDPNAGLQATMGWLRSTATGPDGTKSTVVARVNRTVIPTQAPGAIYLSQDAATNANFNGNAFQIDGNDRMLNGSPGPAPAIPGLSTRNSGNTQEAIGSLSGIELDN